jgi:hypothetical protein
VAGEEEKTYAQIIRTRPLIRFLASIDSNTISRESVMLQNYHSFLLCGPQNWPKRNLLGAAAAPNWNLLGFLSFKFTVRICTTYIQTQNYHGFLLWGPQNWPRRNLLGAADAPNSNLLGVFSLKFTVWICTTYSQTQSDHICLLRGPQNWPKRNLLGAGVAPNSNLLGVFLLKIHSADLHYTDSDSKLSYFSPSRTPKLAKTKFTRCSSRS